MERKKWKQVIERCSKKPMEAKIRNEAGWFLLHLACYKKAPLCVIQHLYNTFPEGAGYKSVAEWLPIDICMA